MSDIDILDEIRDQRLTIHKLSDSISAIPSSNARSSDASDQVATNTYPAALEAELQHYKELFSKLRFNYLEQVTKEKFLRAITEEPPLIVEAEQNATLERDVLEAKAQLQQKKQYVNRIMDQLKDTSRRIAPMYLEITKQVNLALELPERTADMCKRIAAMTSDSEYGSEYSLPLSDTVDRLTAADAELLAVQRELDSVLMMIPKKQREIESLENEISVNEANKEGLEKFATEAVRVREGARAAGKVDRENAGQWYKSSYETLSALLDENQMQT